MSFVTHPSFLSTREHPLSNRDMNFPCICLLPWPHLCFGNVWVEASLLLLPQGLHGCTGRVVTLSPSTLGHNLSCLFHPWRASQLVCMIPDIIFMINEGLSESIVSLSCYGERNASSKDSALPISCSNCTAISAFWFSPFPKFGYVSFLPFLFDSWGFTEEFSWDSCPSEAF